MECEWLFFFVANSSKSLRTDRGNVGRSGRECNLARQIWIASSSGTLLNKEHTSKELIVSLLCLCGSATFSLFDNYFETHQRKPFLINFFDDKLSYTSARSKRRLQICKLRAHALHKITSDQHHALFQVGWFYVQRWILHVSIGKLLTSTVGWERLQLNKL